MTANVSSTVQHGAGMPASGGERVPWFGRAALGRGWAVFVGRVGDNRPHRHPALQLCVGQGAAVRVDLDDATLEAPGVLIGTDVRHALNAGPVWLLYVERQSTLGRRLEPRGGRSARPLDGATCDRIMAAWQAAELPERGVVAVVDCLSSADPLSMASRGSLARVHALIEALPALPPEEWSSTHLARRVHLSPSRFAHVFREIAGVAVRPHLRWLRLAKALEAAARGRSMTEAAYGAGFADAAHFTRTMLRHFGIGPRAVIAALRAHPPPD